MKNMIKKVLSFWNTRQLRTKFLLIYAFVLLAPVCTVDAVFFMVTVESARENAMMVLRNNQENVAQSINSKVKAIESVGELLSSDIDIRRLFSANYVDETTRAIDYQMTIGNSVNNLLRFNTDINAIYLYNHDLIICEMMDSFFTAKRSVSPDVFARLNLLPFDGLSRWILPRQGMQNEIQPQLSPKRSVSYQRMIFSRMGDQWAYAEVILDEQDLFAVMYEQTQVTGGYTCIVDENGYVLFSTADNEGRWIQSLGFHDFDICEEKYEFSKDAAQLVIPLDGLQAALVTCVPMDSLLSGMYSPAIGVVLLSLLFFLFSGGLFVMLTRRQLHAIPPMMEAMRQIRHGNFNTRVPDFGGDELGALAKDFNYMSAKLQGLVDQVYVAGQMEREAELHALEAHINPHFLYNSLATITWMARARGFREIVETTEALAELYRMVLSGGKTIIPFGDEMQIVRAYLKVQKTRFEDKFEVEFDVDEETLTFPIIKNIVQPLIENALDHGLSLKREKGHVFIHARIINQRLEICIVDDGVGMSEERRREVTLGTQKIGKKGYAIRNIRARLNVFYEGDYEFALHSQLGQGTTVQIRLPRPQAIWKGEQRDV